MTSDSQANLRRTWRIPTHFLQRFFLLGMMTVCVRSFRATTFRARSVPTKPKIHGTFPFDRRKYHAWKSSPFSSGATCSTTRIPSLMRRSMSQTNKEIMAATGYDKPKIRSKSDMQRIPAWQKELNPTQLEAVTKPVYSITRVVAGPGSGKTRVLTSRIAFLLNEDPKARILAVTFTRKAAGEMKQRLENLLKDADGNTPENRESTRQNYVSPENNHEQMIEEEYHGDGSGSSTYIRALSRVSLGTFHKICADILRYNGNYLASLPSVERDMVGRNATLLDGRFAIMDQSDQLRIMKECLAAANIDLKDAGGIKPLVVLNALSQLKDSINKGEDPFQTDSKQKKIPKQVEIAKKIYGIYRESMLSNNLLDFDDLIYLTRELLMENQEIRQQLHRRWTHILVDEYQDTSRAQIDLVRLWTSSSLLVVGDGDQSIYSWRGADPNSLSTFDEEFKGYLGDIETVHLTENYRSTANIVKAAQKVISSGEKSLAEKLRQNMKPKRGSGSTPRIVACADGKAEGELFFDKLLFG